jgi:ectoine hydroxylase-related dioxygenase (phytanoyl-CoA dioxygenase family)
MTSANTLEQPKMKAAYVGCDAEVKPASNVWRGPDPTSVPEQVEFLKREGFIVLRRVLDRKGVDELLLELDRLAHSYALLPRIRDGLDLEPRQDAARKLPTFRKIGGICEMSPAFARLMRNRRVLDVLHPVMGKVIELYRDVCMMKPARVGREKPWHQDSVYWPWDPMACISAMTALDDASPENGCLQVVPRSHLKALQHYGKELQCDVSEFQDRTTYVPLEAGDILIFHGLMLHASEPNRSDQDRRVCIVSYKTPDLKYIGKGEPPEPHVISARL